MHIPKQTHPDQMHTCKRLNGWHPISVLKDAPRGAPRRPWRRGFGNFASVFLDWAETRLGFVGTCLGGRSAPKALIGRSRDPKSCSKSEIFWKTLCSVTMLQQRLHEEDDHARKKKGFFFFFYNHCSPSLPILCYFHHPISHFLFIFHQPIPYSLCSISPHPQFLKP